MAYRKLAIAIALAVTLLLQTDSPEAANGDCAQPLSNGSGPAASDCQFILKVAVGIGSCTPACICAPAGELPAKASDALRCLRKAVGQSIDLNCPCAAVPESDNFNDNVKDPARWDDDVTDGNGELDETGGTLEYTANPATDDDYALRPWTGRFPYNADWEVQMDLTNHTLTDDSDQVNSYGISIIEEGNAANEVYGEMYASGLVVPSGNYGFYGELYGDDAFINFVDTDDLGAEFGAVRIAFDAATKVFTLYYDLNPANGYSWIEFGSFGVDGDGGSDDNTDWNLDSGDRFELGVYGISENMTIPSDQIFGDNFQTTGGVEP